jgi:deoxyribonuclease V
MHDWDLTPKQAVELQKRLARRVVAHDRLSLVKRVAGVDVHPDRRGAVVQAAVAVLSLPDLELVEESVARCPVSFPYVPGLLSFRESPAVLLALEQLPEPPDLLLCDGQGLAHPRRFGLACHLGLLTDIPSIGVAKSRLTGCHEEAPEERGSWTPLYAEAAVGRETGDPEILGAVLRTRTKVKPVFVSVGYRVSLATAIDLVLRCCTRYRLPEPARWAHRLAGEK